MGRTGRQVYRRVPVLAAVSMGFGRWARFGSLGVVIGTDDTMAGGFLQRVQDGADRGGGARVGGQGGDYASGGDAGDRDEDHVGVVGAAADAGGGEAGADSGGD